MRTVAIPLIYEKEKLFKKVAPFIEKGYMRKIYNDEHLAVFSFGEISYLACPYIPDTAPFGLLVTAKEAEYIVTENTLHIVDLLKDDASEEKFIDLSKETFENCPSIIKDLKERITDEIIDYKMEDRIKQYALAEIKKCEQSKAKLETEKRPHIKKLLRFLFIAVLLFALQFTCLFTKDFRCQFNDIRQAEQFNKFLDTPIMLILGLVIMMVGAIKYGFKIDKIQNLITPLKGRISCLKENEYVQVSLKE